MDDLICLICRDSSPDFTTRCNHIFHKSCLESWLENKSTLSSGSNENESTCPLCQKPITNNLDLEKLLSEKNGLNFEKFSELSLELEKIILYEIADRNDATLYDNNLETLAGYVKILNLDKNDRLDLLHRACESGNLNLIKILLKENAKIFDNSRDGENLKFLSGNNDLVNKVDDKGHTLLHKACSKGYLDIVKLLIHNGAEVNAVGNGADTPLHSACSWGRIDVVKLLIDNGAEVNAVDNDGETPLHEACYRRNLEIVKLLIDNGAAVNAIENDGEYPLHKACRIGNLDIVKLLIEKNAEVNVVDNDGDTPLHYACSDNPNQDIVKLLIEKNAEVNVVDNDGDTPLHYACSDGNLDIVKLLIGKNAEVNVVDNDGKTPFQKARNNSQIKGLLIDNGAEAKHLE